MNENTENEIVSNPVTVQTNVFPRALLSMLLLWMSFPPVGFWFLAWLSLIPLMHITCTKQILSRAHYIQLWLTGLAYWLATLHFVPIPHPVLWLGWIVLGAYLAFYLPIFVCSTRVLNATFRIPFAVSASVCWTGLELVRNHLFTGMGLACVSHTQFRQPIVLQISDLFGAYTLTFVIVLVNCSLLLFVANFRKSRVPAVANGIAGLVTIALAISYGWYQIEYNVQPSDDAHISVGIIQGSMDTNLLANEDEYLEFLQEKSQQYVTVNNAAISSWDKVDLILWPENGWPYPDLSPDTDKTLMPQEDVQQYEYAHFDAFAKLFVNGKPTPSYLVGAVTYNPVRDESRGSALFISEQGIVQDRYYKNHLVMFGEYTPMADWFPALKKIPAIGKGLIAGTESAAIEIKEINLMPNICFESTVPHYVRRQIRSLAESGNEPDAMVNLTNDGWFYGTSCLDFHLACNVFRSVEMRKPNLVAANTGISAHINALGQIVDEGPRRETGYILAQVQKHDEISLYRKLGDTVVIAFACITLFALFIGCIKENKLFGSLTSKTLTSDQ